MRKLQAAMKDRSAKTWSERRHMFKVGSYFKGCLNCGEVAWVPWGDREVKRYLSGYQVFRSYDPAFLKWTWWCWECGAKDLRCWEESDWVLSQLGKPPLMGCRDAKAAVKRYILMERQAALGQSKPRPEEVVANPEIEVIKKRIAELEALLKGGK